MTNIEFPDIEINQNVNLPSFVDTDIQPITVQITPNEFDNDITLLYRWARSTKFPARLLIVDRRNINTLSYETIPALIARLQIQNDTNVTDLNHVYSYINTRNPSISREDVLFGYYYALLEVGAVTDQTFIEIDTRRSLLEDIQDSMLFKSQEDLTRAFMDWSKSNAIEYMKDMRTLDLIESVQEELFKIQEEVSDPSILPMTPVVITRASHLYRPLLIPEKTLPPSPNQEHRTPSKGDGLDVFNSIIVSRYIPYVRYNDSLNNTYYKLFTGDKLNDRPNYKTFMIPDEDASKPDTIYLSMWLGKPNPDSEDSVVNEFNSAPKESFFIVEFSLLRGLIIIDTPLVSETKRAIITTEFETKLRAQNALPCILLGTGEEMKVKGQYRMYTDQFFDEGALLNMVLTDPVMNVYLYLEENSRPFAFKKNLTLHYRSILSNLGEAEKDIVNPYISNYASVSFNLTQLELKTKQDGVVLTTGDIVDLDPGIKYFDIQISYGETRDEVLKFSNIFRLLMKYYYNNADPYIQGMDLRMPDRIPRLQSLLKELQDATIALKLAEHSSGKKSSKDANKKTGEKLELLKEEAPELFISNYSRACQKNMHPTIISQEESELISPDKIVLAYPLQDPKWWFICTDPKYPYPTLKLNTLKNKDQFKYFPCCSDKDERFKVDSVYYRALRDLPQLERIGTIGKKLITTHKIGSPGVIGEIPLNITRALGDKFEFKRFGMPRTYNSAIHCVCEALQDVHYKASNNKEYYAQIIRNYMAEELHPSLFRQELYDYNDFEIKSMLKNTESFFDPAFFYRGLEELFNINIYVLSPPFHTEVGGTGNLEVPRFRMFHTRPVRSDRPVVIIYKTRGSESNQLQYPQCELVVGLKPDGSSYTACFGDGMAEQMHKLLQDVQSTYTWDFSKELEPIPRKNAFDYLNLLDSFKMKAVSQFIDKNGKLRALTFDVGVDLMTVITMPGQPENLPVSDDFRKSDYGLLGKILKNPTGYSLNLHGEIDGLWYEVLDFKFGLYVPVANIPGEVADSLELGPVNPLFTNGDDYTKRAVKLQRTINIITQVIKWLYELVREEMSSEEFCAKYIVNNPGYFRGTDTAKYYDISKVPRHFPSTNRLLDGLDFYNKVFKDLVQRADSGELYIVMYSEEFEMKIIRMLKDYERLRVGTFNVVADYIGKYYLLDVDFEKSKSWRVFIGNRELTDWLINLETSKNMGRYFAVNKTLNVNMANSPEPYLYIAEDENIYIVQNVVEGSIDRALYVAFVWDKMRMNVGYMGGNEMRVSNPRYMIYGISSTLDMIPLQDNTEFEENYLRVLVYGSVVRDLSKYAALLPLYGKGVGVDE